MGGTSPLANSERFILVDTNDNNTNHSRDRKILGSEGGFNFNRRNVTTILSIVCFVLSFILFIAAIVVYRRAPSPVPVTDEDCTKALKVNANLDETPSSTSTTTTTSATTTTTKRAASAGSGGQQLSVTRLNGKNVKPGILIYEEQFNSLDPTAWKHLSHDPNQNFVHYVNSRNNSYTRGGILYLKPTYTADAYGEDYVYNGTLFLGHFPSKLCVNNNASALCWKENANAGEIVYPIMSPMIFSEPSFSFMYGRLEIRAKMPGGDWIRPMVSLLPNASDYGTGLQGGQIQLVDARGNRELYDKQGTNIGSAQTCPDIRFGTTKNPHLVWDCLNTYPDQGFDTDFHIYQVEWTPDAITLSIDGDAIVTAPYPRKSMYDAYAKGRPLENPWRDAVNKKMAPFDKEFFLVLGIKVGGIGGHFSDEYQSSYKKPWRNTEKTPVKSFWENRHDWEPSWKGDAGALQIDYVRLYSLNATIQVNSFAQV